MNRILVSSVCALALVLSVSFGNIAEAASQCVGLSSSACSSKSSQCTWRKASVNKNGNKTKAHCRALPGKAKTSSSSKSKGSKAKTSSALTRSKEKASATKKKASSSKSTSASKKSNAKKELKKKTKKKTKKST